MNGFTNITSDPPRREGEARLTLPLPCRSLGSQCHALPVTLRVGGLDEGTASLDDEGTWLLGHTGHISFGSLRSSGGSLLVDATLHVPCRYYKETAGQGGCVALGFSGPAPVRPPLSPAGRRKGGARFELVGNLALAEVELREERTLPVLSSPNPCATAECRTADHVRGAACCRDLQLEILCPREDRGLESLVRARKSPYLCKVDRESDHSLEVEMISECSYLGEDGRNCALHGRQRPDGTPAKPSICFDWPDDEVYHPGCVFAK